MAEENGTDGLVTIDEARLDEEWINQPNRFLKYARKLADAKRDVALEKAALDVCMAELNLDVRNNPAAYHLPKVTEDTVEACVLTQPNYQAAMSRLINARHKQDIYQAAVDALEHKKRALENLVTLHGQEYFAAPRARTTAGKVAAEEYGKKAARSGGKK